MSSLTFVYRIPARYLILLSLAGYVILAFWFPLIPNFDRQPVADIRAFAPGMLDGALYGLVLVWLFFLHGLLYHRFSRASGASLKHVLGITVLLALPIVLMYPINANDIYRYVIRGLISSRYGVSPFIYTPSDFGDKLYPLLAGEWASATSPYGPVWEIVASVLTSFGQDDLLANLILFKLIGGLSLVASSTILWAIFTNQRKDPSESYHRRIAYTILWAWNPALILTFVGNAHNDALMVTVLILGWLIVILRYHGLGLLIMLLAALIKPIALLALPLILVTAWREMKDRRSRIAVLLWFLGGGLLVTLVAFWPFGSPAVLLGRLLREASASASFSLSALLILLTREVGWMVPFNAISLTVTIIFTLFYLWLLWRTWGGTSPVRGVASAFWGYVIQALNFRIWYAVWPFPWLLLDAYDGTEYVKHRMRAGLWFLITSQLSVIIYGHFRITFLGGSQLLAHLIGVPFVFILPFFLARFPFPDQNSIDRARSPS